jgi:hypothetical protein
MIVQSAFDAAGKWYRGNVHTHSSRSDARLTPAEVIDFYRTNGYDFIALTDHLIFANPADWEAQPDFLVVPGIENHGVDPESGMYHLVGLGGDMAPATRCQPLDSFRGEVERLLSHGMLVHFAHPYWSGQQARHLAEIDGPVAVEVYNVSTDVGTDKGYSDETWDQLLTAGRRLWGLAVDDSHWLAWRPPDAGYGWLMVKAETLSLDAILEALRQGHFYSTQGPIIRHVRVEGDELCVGCSPAAKISAIGDRWFSSTARNTGTPPSLTEARLKLWRGQTYVRAVVTDRIGRRAWSNPIFLT